MRFGVVGALLVISCLLVFAAYKRKQNKPELTPEQEVPIPVMTSALISTSVVYNTEITARLEPWNDVWLSAEQDGRVLSLNFDRGDKVDAGMTLLTLDNRTQLAAFQRADAALTNALQDLARYLPLVKAGSVSEEKISAVKMALSTAQAVYNDAKVRLEQCRVISPVSGIVQERTAEIGQFMKRGDQCMRLVNVSKMRLVAFIPERDLSAVSKGDSLQFTVDAQDGGVYSGRCIFLASQSHLFTNTYRCDLEVDNPGELLKGGMLVRLSYPRSKLVDRIVIPLDSLIAEKGQYFAYVCKDGRAERRIVRIAMMLGGDVVVRDGLLPGDQLIIQGQRLVSDGAAVEEMGD